MKNMQRFVTNSMRLLSLVPMENRLPLNCQSSSLSWVPTDKMKSVRVAIIGNPNVGKSTLLNSLMKQYISPVSPIRKTTLECVLGVITHDDTQVVFIDTPGLLPAEFRHDSVRGKTKRQRQDYFNNLDVVSDSVQQADCALFMFDTSLPAHKLFLSSDLVQVIDQMPENITKILVLNKIDKEREKAKIEQVVTQLTTPMPRPNVPQMVARTDVTCPVDMSSYFVDGREFDDVISVSAIQGTHMEWVWYRVRQAAVYRPWEYSPETVSPSDIESVVTSLVRAELLTLLGTKLGYTIEHKFVGFREEDDTLIIDHVIFNVQSVFEEKEHRKNMEDVILGMLEERFGCNVQFRLMLMYKDYKENFLDMIDGDTEPTIDIVEET